MMKRLHRHVIATGLPPYFVDANQSHPHRSLSILPIKLQPISSAGNGPRLQFSHMLARPSLPDLFIYFWNSPMENQKACIQYRHSSRMRERKPSKRLFLSWPPASCEGFARDCPHDGGWPIQPALRVGRQGVSFKHRA